MHASEQPKRPEPAQSDDAPEPLTLSSIAQREYVADCRDRMDRHDVRAALDQWITDKSLADEAKAAVDADTYRSELPPQSPQAVTR